MLSDCQGLSEWDPPGGLRPAECDFLRARGLSPRGITATVFDLRDRGHLRVEAAPDGGDSRVVLVRPAAEDGRPRAADLALFEAALLDGLFGRPSEVVTEHLSPVVATRTAVGMDRALLAALRRAGLIRRGSHRRPTRRGTAVLEQLPRFRAALRRSGPTFGTGNEAGGSWLSYAIAQGLAISGRTAGVDRIARQIAAACPPPPRPEPMTQREKIDRAAMDMMLSDTPFISGRGVY